MIPTDVQSEHVKGYNPERKVVGRQAYHRSQDHGQGNFYVIVSTPCNVNCSQNTIAQSARKFLKLRDVASGNQ